MGFPNGNVSLRLDAGNVENSFALTELESNLSLVVGDATANRQYLPILSDLLRAAASPPRARLKNRLANRVHGRNVYAKGGNRRHRACIPLLGGGDGGMLRSHLSRSGILWGRWRPPPAPASRTRYMPSS